MTNRFCAFVGKTKSIRRAFSGAALGGYLGNVLLECSFSFLNPCSLRCSVAKVDQLFFEVDVLKCGQRLWDAKIVVFSIKEKRG